MNYDEMEAGHEMDVLVAEKVMGWKREPTYFGAAWCWTGAKSLTWSPSTDISAAWEVMERMKELSPGYTVEVGWYHEEEANPATPGGWTAMIEGDDWIIYNKPAAPTAPLAICRAALKAVEK